MEPMWFLRFENERIISSDDDYKLEGSPVWGRDADGRPGAALFLDGTDGVQSNSPIVVPAAWTLSFEFKTPLTETSSWHTLVRGGNEDHLLIINNSDQTTVGAYD